MRMAARATSSLARGPLTQETISMIQALSSAPGLLGVSPRIEERLRRGELTRRQVDDFQEFLGEVERTLLHHRIITDNAYTRWFQSGAATDDELRHFVR